jgi:hypothetical protein
MRKRFPRRQTIAHRAHELYQADLADFQPYARHNRGFRYVLIVVDVLSKYVYYIPVKSKKPNEMIRAFKQVFKHRVPVHLQTDAGTEFTAKEVQAYLSKKGVHWYRTFSEMKASLAERQVRTLKEKLTRLFHHSGKPKYIHVLSSLATAYNQRPHTTTGLPPVNVTPQNEQQVFKKLFGRRPVGPLKPRYSIGQQVRLAVYKGPLTKGYVRRWSEEVFTIKRIKLSNPIMYYVADVKNEDILGGFYQFELLPVIKTESAFWDIERILRRRKDKDGKIHYFVKFKGYSDAHNAWVTDLKKK